MSQTKAQLISDLVQALNFTGTASAPANGAFLSAANTLALATNSAQRLTIDSSGNVGIGTTSPGQLLHINKSTGTTLFKASVAGNSTIGLEIVKTGSTTQSWRIVDGQTVNGKLEFYDVTDSATRMCIDGSGNIGIGTTSPNEKLEVSGDIQVTSGSIKVTGATPGVRFTDTADTGGYGHVGVNNSSGSLVMRSDDGNALSGTFMGFEVDSSERMRIDSSGRIGIGTTLQSDTNSSGAGLKIETYLHHNASYNIPEGYYAASLGEVQNTENKVWIAVSSHYARSSAVSAGLFLSAFHQDAGGSGCGSTIKNLKTGNALTFNTVTTAASTGNPAVETERMRIDSSGNVGIGTTSPSFKLHLQDSSAVIIQGESTGNNTSSVLQLKGKNSSGTVRTAKLAYDNADQVRLITPDAIPLCFYTQNGERMRIDSSGRVLIGTTTEGHTSGDNLTIAATDGEVCGITLRSDTDEGGRIFFSDGTSGDDEYRGVVGYSHGTNHLYFSTDASERMRINSAGNLLIGTTSTSGTSSSARDIVIGSIGDSTTRGITLATTTSAAIRWADAGDNAMGRIQYSNSADVMTFHTSNVERLRIDSAGRLLYGLSSSTRETSLILQGNSNSYTTNPGVLELRVGQVPTAQSSLGSLVFGCTGDKIGGTINAIADDADWSSGSSHPTALRFFTTPASSTTQAERMRINRDGEIYMGDGFGDTNRSTILSICGAHQSPSGVMAHVGIYSNDSQAANKGGSISFGGQDGSTAKQTFAAILGAKENSTSGNYAGYLSFFTRPDGAVSGERMRIASDGDVLFGTTSSISGGVSGAEFHAGNGSELRCGIAGTGNSTQIRFYNGNGEVGAIRTNGSATVYHTSSDYRRKENAVAISDGVTRLKNLKPYRFNFKADSSTILDGFFAHEVSPVVPEAISGTKDEVDSNGDPVYQGIDQSKLVPLLTAALQETVAKIEVLETKVAALEAA